MNQPHEVEQEWIEFFEMVYPNGCSDAQRRSLRMAFYAGALGVCNVLMMQGVDQRKIITICILELQKIGDDQENFRETIHPGVAPTSLAMRFKQ